MIECETNHEQQFQDLLENYEIILSTVERARKEGERTKSYWNAYQDALLRFFWASKTVVNFKPTVVEPTPEEKEIYGENGDLANILVYRGYRVPIYIDDAGQQDYIVFHEQTFGGGAYNFLSEYDFCDFIDEVLDCEIRKIHSDQENKN